MAENCIIAEVAYATSDLQIILKVKLSEGDSIEQAILLSGILKRCPEIDLSSMKVGVFGKVLKPDAIVKQNDRVEIYRPLLFNPMDARRNRAKNH